MISSKVTAYEFENDEWRSISRWKLIKMGDVEYKKYKATHKWYLSKSFKSPELGFNTFQKTFRFLPNQGLDEKYTSKGMTISHLLAQEVISEIRVLNLKLIDKRTKPYKKIKHQIEVENIFLEERYTAGGNPYVADLLVFFNKPYDLSLRWNRYFTIEIFVTKDVDGKKIIDCEASRVPVIELDLWSKLVLKKSPSETTEKEENDLRSRMHGYFRKQISASLLVNPMSQKYKENKAIQEKIEMIDALTLKNRKLEKQKEQITEKATKLVDKHNDLVDSYNSKSGTVKNLRSKLEIKKQEIIIAKNKSLLAKVVQHYKEK